MAGTLDIQQEFIYWRVATSKEDFKNAMCSGQSCLFHCLSMIDLNGCLYCAK